MVDYKPRGSQITAVAIVIDIEKVLFNEYITLFNILKLIEKPEIADIPWTAGTNLCVAV